MIAILTTAVITGFACAILTGNLSSWIVNEIHDSKEDIKLNVISSKLKMYGMPFPIIAGVIGSEYLFKMDIRLPFIIAAILFVVISVVIMIIFKNEKIEKNQGKKISEQYLEVVKQVKNTMGKKEIYYLLLFYFILDLIDLGPSEQWQAVYKEKLGIVWTILGISGIISAYISSKINADKMSKKRNLVILVAIDILIVLIQTMSEKFVYMFFIQYALLGIIGVVLYTYNHAKIITSNESRATVVSVMNTITSLLMTIMLSVNGVLSEKFGILNTWRIFLGSAVVLLIVVLFWKEPENE